MVTSPSMHWNPSETVSPPITVGGGAMRPRNIQTSGKVWIALDVSSVVMIAVLTTLYWLHVSTGQAIASLIHGTLIHGTLIHGTLIPGRSIVALGIFVSAFATVLVLISHRLNLYNPMQLQGFLHEQRLSLHASLSSVLLLAGALYLIRADDIPRMIVVVTGLLVAICLGVRRLLYRIFLYRNLRLGVGARNVLIVGTGLHAAALRQQLEQKYRLGYRFQGFIQVPGEDPASSVPPDEIVGDIGSVFNCARRHFVEELLLASPNSSAGMTASLLEGARSNGIDLRATLHAHDDWAWQNPVEYIGQIPSIPILCKKMPEFGGLFKRCFDIAFSLCTLVLLSPLFAVLALVIKVDSPGPVFYVSERIGKKGLVFRCIKFRSMIQDADRRLAEVAHMNERDGVLFKVSNDPRITCLGRFLRKYSLDELPQFFNVLRGEMSVVGPRPAFAGEVSKYELNHLRRLDVTPGITGLWQVQGRQNPSFNSYVSLDVNYIDNWSPWLDFKIILRTIGVVVAGTGV